MGQRHRFILSLEHFDAVIFDADGVVTDTARVHATAWKAVFDALLRARATRLGEEFRPFDVPADYLRYVEGKPRLDGIRDFLASRGIPAAEAIPSEHRSGESLRAIGDRKDTLFLRQIRRDGVAAFPATVGLVRELRRRGARTATVSASRHSAEMLRRAGVSAMFDVSVDGADAARLGFPGKPDPGLVLEAARRLGLPPARVAVVDDSPAGIAAAHHGGFGFIVGIERGDRARATVPMGGSRTPAQRVDTGTSLTAHADLVVADLADLEVTGRVPRPVATA